MLDRAAVDAAVLVCAPAGSGKTLLLADWLRRGGRGTAAWVSLDADDNDERRFWSSILDALAGCPAVPLDSPLRRFDGKAFSPGDPGFLAELLDALGELAEPVRLVLDDVQEIVAPEPLHGLESLLRHRPPGLWLVLSARWEPPLPLARLRLAGQLVDVCYDQLRFSASEAAALLRTEGLETGADLVARLVTSTEGWAVGLRLAAMSMAGAGDPDRDVAESAATNRAIADYLADEVLSPLSEPERDLLRTISVCERLSASLAITLCERADAGELLAALEHRTCMLVRIGPGDRCYRLHPLLRAHLLASLTWRTPHRVPVLHRKAAEWLRARQQPTAALWHATQAADAALVADLVRGRALTLVLSGDHDLLRRAMTVLLDAPVSDDPWWALSCALIQLVAGEPEPAQAQLSRADRAWPLKPSPELDTLRQVVAARQAQVTGDAGEMVRTAPEADVDPAGNPCVGALALLSSGTAGLATGRPAAARRLVESALVVAREQGFGYLEAECLTTLGDVSAAEGDFRAMAACAQQAAGLAAGRGWQHTVAGTTATVLLAYAALLQADPGGCLAHLDRAPQQYGAGVTPGLMVQVRSLRGAALIDSGEWAAGLRQLRDLRLSAPHRFLLAGQLTLAAVYEQRAATLLGHADLAKEVIAWLRARAPSAGEVALLRASWQLGLGRHAHARTLLRPLLDGSVEPLLAWTVVEAWLLEAEIALHNSEQAQLRRAGGKALALAERQDVLRPLVFAGSGVLELVERQRARPGMQRFAARVLDARAALGDHPSPVLLTERERNVLRLLPTVRSLEEIARDLTVSPNTVKTHVRAIYRKLGVGSRRAAVASATARGLVDL